VPTEGGPIERLGYVTTHQLAVAVARKFRDMVRNVGVDITHVEKSQMNHVYPVDPSPEGKGPGSRSPQRLAATTDFGPNEGVRGVKALERST
jgi:hypothetical protein